jgi:hypothetical protein
MWKLRRHRSAKGYLEQIRDCVVECDCGAFNEIARCPLPAQQQDGPLGSELAEGRPKQISVLWLTEVSIEGDAAETKQGQLEIG